MRIDATIAVDTATPAIAGLRARFSGRVVNGLMADSVALLIQEHLVTKNSEPNKLGGNKTNFYAVAAGKTFAEATASEGIVYIAKDGIRQRYHGGTIRPVNRKALTVPVDARAHGRTASEFGGELRFVPINRGNVVGLLKLGTDSAAPVLFLLVKQVKQDPDPSVLPTDDELRSAAIDGLAALPI